jgi:hypothetical protein
MTNSNSLMQALPGLLLSLVWHRARRSMLVAALLSLSGATGCWVQSVYPFYDDSNVAVDPGLVGSWVGQEELKSCLLNIKLDAATRTYTVEVSESAEKNTAECETAAFEGKLVQVGQQSFFDVVPDPEKCRLAPLETLLKVEADKQKLSLTPLDPEWMANALEQKGVKLRGRTQEFGTLPKLVAVTLTSPTSDLREFVALHLHEKAAFSESGRMTFQRR